MAETFTFAIPEADHLEKVKKQQQELKEAKLKEKASADTGKKTEGKSESKVEAKSKAESAGAVAAAAVTGPKSGAAAAAIAAKTVEDMPGSLSEIARLDTMVSFEPF